MKISLLCSIALLMAAPLTAQSGQDPVKSAMNLLEKSQIEAAAGNLEAAAELAAKAQALLQESKKAEKQARQKERVELELRELEQRVQLEESVLKEEQMQLEQVREELIKLESSIDGEVHELIISGDSPQVEITADGLVMIQDEDGTGRLVELQLIGELDDVSGGCCGDCGDDCSDCASESSCEAVVECEVEFADCEEQAAGMIQFVSVGDCEEIVCEEGSEGKERVALQWAVEAPHEGAVQWVMDPQTEGELMALGYVGEETDFTTRNHWSQGPAAPHAQHGDDLHRELQALHMELQALRMELQALRMSMGMAHGNMGGMMGGMGHGQMGHGGVGGMMMAPMQNIRMPQMRMQMRDARLPQMRDTRMPQMRIRSMRLPQAQGQRYGMFAPDIERFQFSTPQGLMEFHPDMEMGALHELLQDGEHQFHFQGDDINLEQLKELGYIGDLGADLDFDFEFDDLHEGRYQLLDRTEGHGHDNDAHGHGEAHGHDSDSHGKFEWVEEGKQAPQVHTEMKLIINGKTYEGEEAKRKLDELGLGDMEQQVRVRVGKGGNTPLPPVPPAPPAKPHSHEEL